MRPETLGGGSTWAVAFSHDLTQKYLLVGDGVNNAIWILNRDNGSVVGQLGEKGGNAGQFSGLQCITTDSSGNVYTGEVAPGNRVQKFVLEKRSSTS